MEESDVRNDFLKNIISYVDSHVSIGEEIGVVGVISLILLKDSK